MTERKNLAASVHQRLLNQAHQKGRTFQEILQAYAIERFLFRLTQSAYADKFILKGALLLIAWGLPLSRPTRDIDLLGYTRNAVEHLAQIVREVCIQPVIPDGMIYAEDSVQAERIKEEAEYEGVRLQFFGFLGPARVRMQIDVGFADVVSPGPVALAYPTLLNLPAPHLRGYSRESVIAEKFQAMVYLGPLNSRMKDFYDLWVLAQQFDFEGERLQEAIRKTFKHRQTDLPGKVIYSFSEEFARARQPLWKSFLNRNRLKDVPTHLSVLTQDLSRFLEPALRAISQEEDFDAYWQAGQGWIK